MKSGSLPQEQGVSDFGPQRIIQLHLFDVLSRTVGGLNPANQTVLTMGLMMKYIFLFDNHDFLFMQLLGVNLYLKSML